MLMTRSGFEKPAGLEVVETACDIAKSIGHDFVVTASVAGIHAVAWLHVAEGFEAGVCVIENLHKDLSQFAGFCSCC